MSSHMQELIALSAPRAEAGTSLPALRAWAAELLSREKPLHGGVPQRYAASSASHSSTPLPGYCCQLSPTRWRLLSRTWSPKAPRETRPTNSKPACTVPSVQCPARPWQSTNVCVLMSVPFRLPRGVDFHLAFVHLVQLVVGALERGEGVRHEVQHVDQLLDR